MKIVPLVRKAKRITKKVITTPKRVKRSLTNPRQRYAYYYKYAKVHPNRMLFDSFSGRGISDSPYAVLQEMMSQGIASDYEIFFTSRDVERDQAFVDANNLPIKLVDFFSLEYPKILATAKYLLSNSSFPQYFIRRPEQVFVETWHGTPLKTLGKQIKNGMQSMYFAQHSFIQASVLTHPNDFTRDAMMRDYNLENIFTGRVAMVGYPRNAIFLKERDASLREQYGLDGYTNFAYMPTWRGTSSLNVNVDAYAADVDAILREIDGRLDDSQRIYVNLHSMVASSITLDSYEHILPFPPEVGTYDFLTQMDALITDYSSVMIDYALTRKPVILFAYDMDEYLADRGMYITLDQLPFPIVTTTDELCSIIADGSYQEMGDAHEAFAERFLKYDSADNAKHVLDILLEKPVDDVPMIDYSSKERQPLTIVNARPQKTVKNLRGILETADPEQEVVLLQRKGFGPVKSGVVYDDYLDRQFVFVTRANPTTHLESKLSKRSPAVKERLIARNRLRLLGNVALEPDVRKAYCGTVAGSSYNAPKEIHLQAHTWLEGTTLHIQLPQDDYDASKIIVAHKREILWDRELTDDEKSSGVASVDIFELLCSSTLRARNNLRTKICLIVKEASTGSQYVADLIDERFDPEGTDWTSRYMEPLVFEQADWVDHAEYNEEGRALVPILNRQNDEKSVYVYPYDNIKGAFSLLFIVGGLTTYKRYKPVVTSVSTPQNQSVVLRIKLPKGPYTVDKVCFVNRAKSSETSHDASFTIKEHETFDRLTVRFDPNGLVFDGVFWDPYVCITDDDGYEQQLLCHTSDALRHSLFFRNPQVIIEDGNVFFPYTRKGKLAFTHREHDKYDSMLTKVKEWSAFGAYALMLPYWKRRHIWLSYEKYCFSAQDNGYHFFRYCMDENPNNARNHVFYVIKKDAADYQNVKQYGRNVIDFMSLRHMLYAMAAELYVSSDTKTHLYHWRSKQSVVRKVINKKKEFFLQHGVMAMKRVDYLLGKKGTTPMTYFLTSSEAEQDIIVKNFGYARKAVPVLGLSRWDVLEDKSTKGSPVILLMPTWRQWLEGVDGNIFLESDYYQAYSELIQNKELIDLLERANAKVKFFIHPKLSERLRHFASQSSSIELIEMGSRPMNEIIMECSACITDYSSVAWDVLYQEKPVVYFQFDQERYLDEVGSYIDLNTELPGPVCKDTSEVVQAISDLIANDFTLSPEDVEKTNDWYAFKDTNNRKRTFDFLQERYPFD